MPSACWLPDKEKREIEGLNNMYNLFNIVLYVILAAFLYLHVHVRLIFSKKWFGYIFLALELALVLLSSRWMALFSERNLHPFSFGAGLLFGHFLFLVSLLINQLSVRTGLKYGLVKIPSLLWFWLSRLDVVSHYIVIVALREEILWRVTIQYIWGNSIYAVIATAFLFTLIHIKPGKQVSVFPELFELFLFALFLGVAFWRYENFTFIVVVHAVRDVNLAWYDRVKEKEITETENEFYNTA